MSIQEVELVIIGSGPAGYTAADAAPWRVPRVEDHGAARVLDHPKIEVVWNSEVAGLMGFEKVEAVALRDVITGAERDLPTTGVFVAIGHDPRSGIVTGLVETDSDGDVLVEHPSTRTNLAGVFAAGDLAPSATTSAHASSSWSAN